MISIEEQQKLLLNISRKLKKQIIVYTVGGTAMMFLGFKDTTLDIDLVFESKKDRDLFKKACRILGYQETNPIKIYGARKNIPEILSLNDERFDLFVEDVIDFVFSENMKKRAETIHQFNKNLILKIADPHDIILMKCATERIKDKDDVRKIINSTNIKINWKLIIEEAKNQIRLGKERAVFDLWCFLSGLKKELKVDIPKDVIDKLSKIVQEQIKHKADKKQD